MMSDKAILCVDDEVIVLMALIRELRRQFGNRFIYEQATDAKQGLQIVEDLAGEGIRVSFLITDWLMPGMKGDEFVERLYELHPDIRTIMITGQADREAIERLKSHPSVDAVLSKPWNANELVRIIEERAVDS